MCCRRDFIRVYIVHIFQWTHCTIVYTLDRPQSTQSVGPVHFLIFCSISIILLASLEAGRRPQCTASADKLGMYSTIPIHWNIKSAPASPGRSRAGPALYVFRLLEIASDMSSVGLYHVYSCQCFVETSHSWVYSQH